MSIRTLATVAALAAATAALAQSADVRYPDGFRSQSHVTTGLVTPGFMFNGVDLGAAVPGLHTIYANGAAWQGYRRLQNGQPGFADGSVITFDLWAPGTLQSGTGSFTFPQQRLAVAVMAKDSKKYAATGGWGFQVFDPVNRTPLLDAAAQQQCFGCHQVTPGTDFVFSRVAN